jgi:hypothetical protein
MDVRFDDHAGFQRSAVCFAAGGAVLGTLGSLPLAVAGSALALMGWAAAPWRPRLLAACACVAAVLSWLLLPHAWSAPACGAMLGLLLAAVRADAARRSGALPPSRLAVAFAALGAAIALGLAAAMLPHLSSALSTIAPAWTGAGLSGGVLGLWAALSAAPLHVRFGGDPVETRLGALRASLGPELRGIAERAVAARRGIAMEMPASLRPELRALIELLTSEALDLAERAGELGQAASPSAEDELGRRSSQLAKSAQSAADEAAKQSYLRAADALSAQLEHFRRMQRARERVLARLHERVVSLERARFSVTFLEGTHLAAELDLLHERLLEGATVSEEPDEPFGPPDGVRA